MLHTLACMARGFFINTLIDLCVLHNNAVIDIVSVTHRWCNLKMAVCTQEVCTTRQEQAIITSVPLRRFKSVFNQCGNMIISRICYIFVRFAHIVHVWSCGRAWILAPKNKDFEIKNKQICLFFISCNCDAKCTQDDIAKLEHLQQNVIALLHGTFQ